MKRRNFLQLFAGGVTATVLQATVGIDLTTPAAAKVLNPPYMDSAVWVSGMRFVEWADCPEGVLFFVDLNSFGIDPKRLGTISVRPRP